MEEETFHNLQEIYIINTIMQENCCHPSWYRCHETPIVKSLLWQYSQYQMAQKKEGYSSRTSLLSIIIITNMKVETLTETFASIRKHNKKNMNKSVNLLNKIT